MRRALIPVLSGNLKTRASVLRTACATTIQKFCKDKVIEQKLSPKTFNFNFEFHGASVDTRRSIVRLKVLLERALEKRLPYVEYAETPFLTIADRHMGVISLRSLPEKSHLSYYDFRQASTSLRRALADGSNFGNLVTRYVRYLQFLCIKYKIPFDIQLITNTKMSSDSEKEYKVLDINGSKTLYPEVQYEAEIRVYTTYWYYTAWYERYNTDVIHDVTSPSMEEYIEELVKTTGGPENGIYNRLNWTSHLAIYGSPIPIGGMFRIPPAHWVIERLFFHIPQIMTSLRTLTRLTSYVPTAFSIGADESS